MALLADGIAQGRQQVSWIDDRRIHRGNLFALLMMADVQLARTVTALAANGIALEDRRPVTIHGIADFESAIAVAEQAFRGNRTGEVPVARGIAGRQIPTPLLRVPGDRRLKKVTVLVDQVRSPARAGTDGEIDRGLPFRDYPALLILLQLSVNDAVATAFDAVVEIKRAEIGILGGLFRLHGTFIGDRHE
jgi:hypothetical protein